MLCFFLSGYFTGADTAQNLMGRSSINLTLDDRVISVLFSDEIYARHLSANIEDYSTTRLIADTNNALYHNKLYYTLQVQQKRIILIYFGKSNAHISSFFLVFTQNLSQYSPDFRKNTAPHASH